MWDSTSEIQVFTKRFLVKQNLYPLSMRKIFKPDIL